MGLTFKNFYVSTAHDALLGGLEWSGAEEGGAPPLPPVSTTGGSKTVQGGVGGRGGGWGFLQEDGQQGVEKGGCGIVASAEPAKKFVGGGVEVGGEGGLVVSSSNENGIGIMCIDGCVCVCLCLYRCVYICVCTCVCV